MIEADLAQPRTEPEPASTTVITEKPLFTEEERAELLRRVLNPEPATTAEAPELVNEPITATPAPLTINIKLLTQQEEQQGEPEATSETDWMSKETDGTDPLQEHTRQWLAQDQQQRSKETV